MPNPYLTKQLLTFNILLLLLKNRKIQTPVWSIRLLTFLYAYDNDDKKNHKNNDGNNNGKTVDEDNDNNDTELTTIKIIVMIKFLTHLQNFKAFERSVICSKFAANNLLR